jgi:hypothetical protein
MANTSESPFRSLIPAAIALGIALWGVLLARPKLESPRPTTPAAATTPGTFRGRVAVRLWQDPLAAVWSRTDEKSQGPRGFAPLRDQMPSAAAEDDTGRAVLFLCLFLEPDGTPETVETRRRERYAVISALSTAGYVPASSESLSFLLPGAPRPPAAPPPAAPGYAVPFEWFVEPQDSTCGCQLRTDNPFLAVCVLWFTDSPAYRPLLGQFAALRRQVDATFGDRPHEVVFSGRLTSARVEELLKADAHAAKRPTAPAHPDLEPGCLSGSRLLLSSSTAPYVRDRPFTFSGLAPEFLIGTDEQLAETVLAELRRRSLVPGTPDCPLALIAESDSTYGRGVYPIFVKALAGDNWDEVRDREGDWDRSYSVACYTYLRGLDGKKPGDKSPDAGKDDAGKDDAGKEVTVKDAPTAQQAEGDSQVDYLQRLVGRMKAAPRPFKAIGVVGSDVYDKLLLLKALRPSFPDALFFTTDLDGRLLQPGDYEATHNLLVASHYGLTLDAKLQCKNPPFRSGYDAASYLAVLRAAKFAHVPDLEARDGRVYVVRDGGRRVVAPRLFEVGRNGAYELSMPAEGNAVHPENPRAKPWVTRGNRPYWALGFLLALGCVCFAVSRSWRNFLDTLSKPARWLWAAAVRRQRPDVGWSEIPPEHLWTLLAAFVAAVLLECIYLSHTSPDGEPFELFEGVSVWPTELMRLGACFLTVGYLLNAVRDLRERNRKICEDFALDPLPRPWYAGLSGFPASAFAMWWWRPESPDVASAWREFQEHGRGANRWVRCLVLGLFNALLVLCLYGIFDHTILHARGALACWADRLLLALSGAALVGLLLFIIDTTGLCYRFVTYLSGGAKVWPEAAVARQAQARNLSLTGRHDADLHRRALEQWLLIRLVADATNVVARSIYYPFVVLLILVLAQNRVFDDWHWNIPLLAVALLCAAAALVCAWLLQHAARRTRQKALEVLDGLIRGRLGAPDDPQRARYEQIRTEVDGMESGAFAGFARNPIVGAVLLPLGGGGGLAALQALLPYL